MAERRGLRADLSDPSIRLIIGTVFITMVGTGIVVPFLTLFARSFGVSYGRAGWLLTSFGAARLLGDLIAGPALDRIGERRAAWIGILVSAASSIATGLAPTFGFALAMRAVNGAGSALLIAALYSSLIKVVPAARMGRALAVFYGSFNVGIIAGGPIGGVLAEWLGLRWTLYAYGAIFLAAAPVALRSLPEVRAGDVETTLTTEQVLVEREGAAPRRGGNIVSLLRSGPFFTAIASNFIYIWVITGVLETLVPLYAKDVLGMSEAAIGGLFAAAVLTELVVLYPAGKVADRSGRKPLLVGALLALAAGCSVLGLAGTPLVLAVMIGVLGVFFGAASVSPGAMVADLVPERSGTAVGVFRFAGDLGFVVAPLVSGLADTSLGFEGSFIVASIPIVAIAVLAAATRETMRRA